MPVYDFSCPICRKPFRLTVKDPSAMGRKQFSCPNCHYSAPFSTIVRNLPQPITRPEPKDTQPIGPAMHSATRVSPGIGMQSSAYLTVIGSNARFVLNQGVYVLGRKSSDSTATLQLAPDISMSRQHARLSVQLVAGKLMAQIVGLKANNPVFVNGKMFAAGQSCTLKSGDSLQLGMTRILFTI